MLNFAGPSWRADEQGARSAKLGPCKGTDRRSKAQVTKASGSSRKNTDAVLPGDARKAFDRTLACTQCASDAKALNPRFKKNDAKACMKFTWPSVLVLIRWSAACQLAERLAAGIWGWASCMNGMMAHPTRPSSE